MRSLAGKELLLIRVVNEIEKLNLSHKLLNVEPFPAGHSSDSPGVAGVLVQQKHLITILKLKLFISQTCTNKNFLLLLNSVVLLHVKLVVGLSHE